MLTGNSRVLPAMPGWRLDFALARCSLGDEQEAGRVDGTRRHEDGRIRQADRETGKGVPLCQQVGGLEL